MDKDFEINVRKDQLTKLKQFVLDLQHHVKSFQQYGANLKDIDMFYTHIIELIDDLLSCDSTEEFLDKIQALHEAIAGVLIVMIPANAAQVQQQMQESYDDFDGENFDEFLNNLHQHSINKFGSKPKEKEEKYEDPNNNPEELVDMLDLKNQVKKAKTANEQQEKKSSGDFLDDVFKDFN